MSITYQHQRDFSIEWGDMDALGHVNNGRYFDYFQEARIEWLHDMGFHLSDPNGPVVVHVSATFLKPVVYPAKLILKSYVAHVGTTSATMNHHLFQNDILVSEGVSKIVWIDYTTGKSIPLPNAFRMM